MVVAKATEHWHAPEGSTWSKDGARSQTPFRVWGLGFRVWGLEFRVWGLGFKVWGSGFRV